jgi:hypothetical protein
MSVREPSVTPLQPPAPPPPPALDSHVQLQKDNEPTWSTVQVSVCST